jgi:DNA-binding Xre family transcriptional regulator
VIKEVNTLIVRHNLQILMAKKKIKSIKELGRITGYDYATLYNFSSYVHKKLDPELVADLCELFGCSIGDLFYLEDRPKEKDKVSNFF